MKRKQFLLVLCFFVLGIGAVWSQTRSYSDIADSVYSALDKRDAGYLLPLLDDSCVISNLPRGINYRLVPLLVKDYLPLKSYKIIAMDNEPGGTRVKMEMLNEEGKASYPDFLVNSSFKITELNVVKNAVMGSERKVPVRTLTAPDTLSVPFVLRDGLIYIKAEADGRKGVFLLDTGSPEMILNRAFFYDSLRLVQTGIDAAGGRSSAGGNLYIRKINSFLMGRMKVSNFAAMVMNNGESAGIDGLPFLGSIGYNTIRDFEISFDMAAGRILFIKTDSEGDYVNHNYRPGVIRYVASIQMKKHIPVIMLEVGDRSYFMGIDCGTASNIFFPGVKSAILPFTDHNSVAHVSGPSADAAQDMHVTLNKATIGPLMFYNMRTVIGDNSVSDGKTGDALMLDGWLGTEFLKCYKTSINFRKRQVIFR